MTKRTIAILLVLALIISLLTGCGIKSLLGNVTAVAPDGDTPVTNKAAGKYILVLWNEKGSDENLVNKFPKSGMKASDFYIELRDDGTYIWDFSVLAEEIFEGTYKVSGNTKLIISNPGISYDSLTMDGDRITMVSGKDTMVYERQAQTRTPSREFSFSEVASAATPVTAEQLLGYYDLTAEEKRLYDQIVDGIEKFDMRIGVDINIRSEADKAMASKIWGLIHSTHPEFFWFRNYDYYPDSSTGADGKYSVLPLYVVNDRILRAQFDGPDKIIYPQEEEVTEVRAWVERAKQEINERLNVLPVHTEMTPFELEVAVYDWLRDNILYEQSDDFDTLFNYKNMYGALVNGEGDCMGYSRTFQYFMCLIGIECLDIGGSVGEGGVAAAGLHGWNAVKLDGEWYNADVTNDSWKYAAFERPWHFYLNRTDQYMIDNGYVIGNDRSGLTVNIANIACTATKYDYYLMTDSYIASDADFDAKVPARIKRARENGEWGFDMKLDSSYTDSDRILDKWCLLDPVAIDGASPFINNDMNIFYVNFD